MRCGCSPRVYCRTCLQTHSRCLSRSLRVSLLAGWLQVICTPTNERVKNQHKMGVSSELPLRKFPDLPPPPRVVILVLNILALAVRTYLLRNEIRLLRRVSIDKVVVPIPVNGDTSLGNHQGTRRDVDKRAARTEAREKHINNFAR